MEKLFAHKSFRSSLLVLTSESVEDLPVTVAVHPAVQLARKKQNVLLVDADLQRHAVAKVFTLDPHTLKSPSSVHRIDHLWLQSIMEEQVHTLQKIQDQPADFVCRILYAPQGQWLWSHLSEQLAKNIKILFFSSKTPDEIRRIYPDAAAAGVLFAVPPIHKAVTQASEARPSAVE